MKKLSYIILLAILAPVMLHAQAKERPVVQFSGFALSADSMVGIPFVHIGLKGTSRGGYARIDGFFSFAVNEGDTLIMTCIGYSPTRYVVPTNVPDNKLSTIIQMNRTSYMGPTTTIYPWHDFRQAFLDLRLDDYSLEQRARDNTNATLLAELAQNLPVNGGEVAMRSMQIRAAQASYYHQQAPQNIFNPLAWAEFIRAIKRGDFKKKPDPQLPSHDY